MIRLYHRPKAGRPVRAAWILEEAGTSFEIVRLSMDETRAAEHLERHPLGRVPVLEDDDRAVRAAAPSCAWRCRSRRSSDRYSSGSRGSTRSPMPRTSPGGSSDIGTSITFSIPARA